MQTMFADTSGEFGAFFIFRLEMDPPEYIYVSFRPDTEGYIHCGDANNENGVVIDHVDFSIPNEVNVKIAEALNAFMEKGVDGPELLEQEGRIIANILDAFIKSR